MPIYAYRCASCGSTEEYIQKFDDPPMTVCEKCGGQLARAVTAAAFHLKGGGWYKDGYASSGGGGDSKSDTSKSDTTSDTKPKSEPAAAAPAPAAPASTKAASE